MKNAPGEGMVRAWIALLRTHREALSSVERALKEADLPPLSWYDVLLELERAEGRELRPFELEEKLLLTQYNLSRLLDRIEAAGYLKRQPCADDARGQVLAITRAGAKLRRRMWPIYAAAIGSALGQLSGQEAKALAALLGRLTGKMGDSPP